jgi:hypothetical protein
MDEGMSLKVRNVIIFIYTNIPDSLGVTQNQPQTNKMDTGAPFEVKNVIISIGTENSKRLLVSKN